MTTVVETARYRVPLGVQGAGPALLYLHSYEGPVAADAAFLAGLAGDRRVLAPTHPGFDGTEATPDLASLHNVVILYLELLDGLGLERVDVMGHSLGAMFAAELAAIAPEPRGTACARLAAGPLVGRTPHPPTSSAREARPCCG